MQTRVSRESSACSSHSGAPMCGAEQTLNQGQLGVDRFEVFRDDVVGAERSEPLMPLCSTVFTVMFLPLRGAGACGQPKPCMVHGLSLRSRATENPRGFFELRLRATTSM